MELSSLLILLSAIPIVQSHLESPKFPGYGFAWYDPNCGYACYNSVSSAMLDCSDAAAPGGHSHGAMTASTPACQAESLVFLQTIAYCMDTRCDTSEVPVWKREQFWRTKLISNGDVQPQYTYSQSLAELGNRTPTAAYNSSSKQVMTEAMLVSSFDYNKQFHFNRNFDHLEMLQARYSFVLVIIGFGIPILCTLLLKLRYTAGLVEKITPYLVYPSIFGSYHMRSLPWGLGNVPTIGQAAYAFLFFSLNFILCAVNYSSAQPHPWYYTPRQEMLSYIGFRTGHVSYALLPLVILFSSRNNVLLWITNWSYGTYVLLHRWIARIFAVQAIVHSITLLILYKEAGTYASASVLPYWSWGIVATVLTCAMLVFSTLYFRRIAYEVFLIGHILFAILVIVGCWYHIVLKWGHNFYLNWLYAAIAVWAFDRIVRVLRVLNNGLRYAKVTDIGGDHVRVDVPGIRWANKPGLIGFVGFPTLNPLRPWENHPFSINASASFRRHRHKLLSGSPNNSILEYQHGASSPDDKAQEESHVRDVTTTSTTAGVTFIIKKKAGMTKLLRMNGRLLTLIDGPYPHSTGTDALKTDRLILIGGGIGITGLLAWFHAHPNVKLAWGVKASAQALIDEMRDALSDVADKEVLVGQRLDTRLLLQNEASAGYDKVGVIVCGPADMCDEVRSIVAGLGRGSKTVFELHVDAFHW